MFRGILTVLVAAIILTAASSATFAAENKVSILAYINQTSGCQRHTEAFLKKLDATYGDRVNLEFVDFGSPKGQKRWRGDGMHCMGIKLDGSTEATIVYKGVELTVAFEMPEGHMWLHDELAVAVRQALEGVSVEDRRGPELAVAKTKDTYAVTVGDTVAMGGLTENDARDMAKEMTEAAKKKPLTQDDFSVKPTDSGAVLLMRDEVLMSLNKADISGDGPFERRVAQRFLTFLKPFPRVSRPFPGLKGPPPRRR